MSDGYRSIRIRWPAIALDLSGAALLMLVAYALRFIGEDFVRFLRAGAPALLVCIAAQITLADLLGLYSAATQRMWPLRLIAAMVVPALLVGFLAPAAGYEVGLSRQALGAQAALAALAGVVWRALDALLVRRALARRQRAEHGHDALVVQGEELGSMVGGAFRVWDYRHLLRNLVAKDLKLKYRGSILGFAWSMLIPLLMIGVYVIAFTYVIKVDTPRFVLYVLVGLLAWNFFAGAVSGSADAIVGGGSLIRSVVFPRAVLPFAAVLFHLLQYLLALAVFLPLMLILYGIRPTSLMLLFPLFLGLQLLFVTGLALGLSTATAAFRDVRHLIDVGLGMLFWATPIIYEMKMVPEQFQFLALLSPAAPFIRAYQDIFYYGAMPEASVWVVAAAYGIGGFTCGLSVFLAYESRFSELV